jgi:hypothetical protein
MLAQLLDKHCIRSKLSLSLDGVGVVQGQDLFVSGKIFFI